MGELTDADIDVALQLGALARLREPRALTVRYDQGLASIVIELSNGCVFAFPPHLAPELEGATAEQLAEVTILGAGSGVHWEALDADLSIDGLLAGLFGTRTAMARLAGRAKSPAKADASRRNGAKGGRPRKLG